jgi:hypothetical protein
MLEPAMFMGLCAVALWAHVRFPVLRPRSLMRAAFQVLVSLGVFTLLPVVLGLALPLLPSGAARISATLALLMASMTYLFLTWIWLIARILDHLLGGTPRGGHPATNKA